ncbi:MAG: ASCH domain-containing protein [Nanoarchaeota archaeon]
MPSLFFKQKYLEFILSGKKPLEGRVGYDNIRRFKVGDYIYLNDKYRAKIINIWTHTTFRDAISDSNYKLLIPDATSADDAIKTYESLYPLWKQKQLGVYIFELKYPA